MVRVWVVRGVEKNRLVDEFIDKYPALLSRYNT